MLPLQNPKYRLVTRAGHWVRWVYVCTC